MCVRNNTKSVVKMIQANTEQLQELHVRKIMVTGANPKGSRAPLLALPSYAQRDHVMG
jgi:hypothetical protein